MESLKFILPLLLFVAGCIGSQLPYNLAKPTVSEAPLSGGLVSGIVTTEGEILNLENFRDQNLVVMFAQFFCDVCSLEAQSVKKSLGETQKLPTNARLLTIVVPSDREEAQDWKKREAVPWTVGAIDNLTLLKKYCPEGKTPCTVVQTKGAKQVWTKQGEVHVSEILNIIGSWYE